MQFRKNVAIDFTMSHPGAVFLMNEHLDRFLVYSRTEGRIFRGVFKDKFHHMLDFVSDVAPASERDTAVARYRRKTESSTAFLSFDGDRRAAFQLSTEQRGSLINRGYYVAEGLNAAEILYVSVSRNESVIAWSDAFDPKPLTYFFSVLPHALRNVSLSATDPMSSLEVKIVLLHRNQPQIVIYNDLYDDFHKDIKEIGGAKFSSMVSMIIDFLTLLELACHEAAEKLELDSEDSRNWYKGQLAQTLVHHSD